MIAWLIASGYGGASFVTWLAGAARIGSKFEEQAEAARKKAEKIWSIPEYRAKYEQSYVRIAMWSRGGTTFLVGLLWPVAIPIYLAFNKGKAVGLKKRQMKVLLAEAEAEIERIKKAEGWR